MSMHEASAGKFGLLSNQGISGSISLEDASGGAAQVTAKTAARVTSATFRTARATGAAGEVAGARAGAAGNEEFLRSYLAEVSAGAVRGIIFSDLSGTVFLRRGCLQADRKERRDRISSVCGGDR